jgi:hypothetical protein
VGAPIVLNPPTKAAGDVHNKLFISFDKALNNIPIHGVTNNFSVDRW